jgi:hypothetical protein
LAILGRSEIENCESRFLFQCPQRWDNLAPTNVAAVRFCKACKERVYYCHNIEEAREHAKKGRCVAVDAGVPRCPGDVTDMRSSDEGELLGLLIYDDL